MPAAIGQSFCQKFTSGDPHTTSTTANTAASGSIFVVVVSTDIGAPTTVADNKSNTYTLLGTQQISGFGDRYTSMYYSSNATPAGGSTHTWTADYAAAHVSTIGVIELTGCDGYVTSTFASRNDDAALPETLDTGASVDADDMVVMYCQSQYLSTEGFTANNGFTTGESITDGSVFPGSGAFLWKVATSTAVQTGSVSLTSSSTESELLIAAFTAAAGGGGGISTAWITA